MYAVFFYQHDVVKPRSAVLFYVSTCIRILLICFYNHLIFIQQVYDNDGVNSDVLFFFFPPPPLPHKMTFETVQL